MSHNTVSTPQAESGFSVTPETELAIVTIASESKITNKEKIRKTRKPAKTQITSKIEDKKSVESTTPKRIVRNSKIKKEYVVQIPIEQLHSPEFNPFNVKEDDAMERLVDSIKQDGVREPGLARKSPTGIGFELLVGNRRKRACELAGILTMPVIIREIDDDNAAITMVDSNLEQREELLFSEKAWAYKIKMEALNHRGIKGDKPSAEILAEQTGESRNQIFRLIRLTELVIDLLDKVDAKQLAFNPAVELSYLSQSEQCIVALAMEEQGIKPSLSQAVRLKKLKQQDILTEKQIYSILSEEKPKSSPLDKEVNSYRKYFPTDYTPKQMHKIITDLLDQWQKSQLKDHLHSEPKVGVAHD